ncbi:MAG: hypothetical protein EA351_09440 [Gemmatimonadales bacterium]|nr:MAG: hypothetical protein EA351_09440 [Gemmatimonadales bacterium]
MREALRDEGAVGPLQKHFVLVPVEVEGGDDRHIGPDHLAEPARHLRLGAGDVAHRHGAVERQVHAIDRKGVAELVDHPAHEVIEGLFGVPAAGGSPEDPARGRESNHLDVSVVPCAVYEAPDVGASPFEKIEPALRLSHEEPVLDPGVAARTEGAGLVREAGYGHPVGRPLPLHDRSRRGTLSCGGIAGKERRNEKRDHEKGEDDALTGHVGRDVRGYGRRPSDSPN